VTHELSPNTQAILLLTAPLLIGSGSAAADILTAKEYRTLALHLQSKELQPADLLESHAYGGLDALSPVLEPSRIRRLLDRGFLLGQAVERWHARSIWVVSRADHDYPRRLKARLREAAPPVLYGCGDVSLLEGGGLAVVGSRHIDDWLLEYTDEIGRLTGRAQQGLISGGARGIDQVAMRGALDVGGAVIGVLSDSLEKVAMQRDHRHALIDHQLVLVSPYDPNAGFNVGNAMQRNKLIYALADAALVVNSDLKKGGTWAGAEEQLRKFRFVTLYVRSRGETGDGLDALRRMGALPWPDVSDPSELTALLRQEVDGSLGVGQSVGSAPARSKGELTTEQSELLLTLVGQSKSQKQIAAELDVSSKLLKDWLEQLVAQGRLQKTTKGKRFAKSQPSLFDSVAT